MIIEFINMGGYGFYIWTSFLIVTVFCYFLYYKTKKTLKKYELELARSSKVISNILASQNKLS